MAQVGKGTTLTTPHFASFDYPGLKETKETEQMIAEHEEQKKQREATVGIPWEGSRRVLDTAWPWFFVYIYNIYLQLCRTNIFNCWNINPILYISNHIYRSYA
jgi:hypothetical protein